MIRLRLFILCLCAALAVFVTPLSSAQNQSVQIDESEVELRARQVGKTLRCVVCQNQSIDESDASLAQDMRKIVRARIRQGDSNADVINFMRERYGDFVLIKPPVQKNTYVLWAAPFLILVLGLFWYWRQAGRRKPAPQTTALSEDEKAAYQRLTSRPDHGDPK